MDINFEPCADLDEAFDLYFMKRLLLISIGIFMDVDLALL